VIYAVHHRTRYAYGSPVDLGAHLLHLSPRALDWQRVLECRLAADPTPSHTRRGKDCFGNDVCWIFLDTPHPAFDISLDARVEVTAPFVPRPDTTLPWEKVSRIAFGGGLQGFEAAEFLFESPMVTPIAEARDYVAKSFPAARPVLEGLIELNTRIRRDFAFRAGVTTVNTPVRQVLAQRAGVCQDFSHLMIAGLRALGLPARYVSGYIRTKPPPGQKRRRGADQSHAWVGCWLGPGHDWVDLDPTNGLIVADEHVVLGWGRDYSDISPVFGVILGGGKHSVSVSVDLEPVEDEEATDRAGSGPSLA
jgi:transglutaminase-like putative cysteine protease